MKRTLMLAALAASLALAAQALGDSATKTRATASADCSGPCEPCPFPCDEGCDSCPLAEATGN